MTDMRRLRDETRSPFARSLLESVEGDGPDSGACDRALGALGLGTAGVVAAGTAAKAAAVVAGSAASASTATTASGLAPAATKGGIVVLVKWIGIGVLGSAVTIGSIAYVDEATHSRAPRTIEPAHASLKSVSPVALPTGPLPPREGASTTRSNAVDDSAISSPSVPYVAGTRESSAVSPSRPAMVVPDGRRNSQAAETGVEDPVAREATSPLLPKKEEIAASDPVTAQLDALSTIRAALASGDPARALVLLDALESRNPMSPLAEEIAVLRIDALVDAGRRDEASTLATTFTSAYPQSAYGQHVRSKTKSR